MWCESKQTQNALKLYVKIAKYIFNLVSVSFVVVSVYEDYLDNW